MGLNESIRESFAGYLNKYYAAGSNPVEKVLSWQEETGYSGCCETCWYEETVVDVQTVLADGEFREFRISQSFASLIGELVSF